MSVQKLFIKLSNPFKSHHFEKFPIKSAFICQQEKVITTYINTHIHFALLLLQTVSCKCNALYASELQRADPSFAIRIHNFYHQTKAQVNVFMSVYQLQASTLTNYALSVVGQPAIGRCFHSNCVNKHSSNNRLWKKKKVSHSHTKKYYLWKSSKLIIQTLMIRESSTAGLPAPTPISRAGELRAAAAAHTSQKGWNLCFLCLHCILLLSQPFYLALICVN